MNRGLVRVNINNIDANYHPKMNVRWEYNHLIPIMLEHLKSIYSQSPKTVQNHVVNQETA